MTDFARLPGGLLNAFRSRFRRSASSDPSPNGRPRTESREEERGTDPFPRSPVPSGRTPTELSRGDQIDRFFSAVREIVGPTAQQKGYSDAIREVCGTAHGAGELIYKALRFREKGNPEDLVKAAAWAFLLWLDQREGRGQPPGVIREEKRVTPSYEEVLAATDGSDSSDPEAENEERARERAEEMGLGEFAPFSEEESAEDRPGIPS